MDIMATHVPFLTTEDGDDLIVSFALDQHASASLTLLRSPKYEPLLPEEERRVSVGSGAAGSTEREMLVAATWSAETVYITSSTKQYTLDIRAVDGEEIRQARRILRKMNFDKRFTLDDA